MRDRINSIGNSADRIGGKIFYRMLSAVPFFIALGFAYATKSAVATGQYGISLMTGAVTLCCLVLVAYMWSPSRRLSDIEP